MIWMLTLRWGMLLLLLQVLSSVAFAYQSDQSASLAAAARSVLVNRCAACHDGAGAEVPLGILDHAKLVRSDAGGQGSLVSPGDPGASRLWDRVTSADESVRMPPDPSPALSLAEAETLRKWIDAGAPAFAEVLPDQQTSGRLTDDQILQKILAYVRTIPEEDRRYLRFFSAAHLSASEEGADVFRREEAALASAVNHLSWEQELAKVRQVDPESGAIWAVDIRDAGWDKAPFQSDEGKSSDFNLFDLVLLEYPYGGMQMTAGAEQLQTEFRAIGEQVRPIPFIRVDWFVSTALQPPLYNDLLGLPRTLAEFSALFGVNLEQNIERGVAKRAGMAVSGVSRNNRVVERHPGRYGYFWASADYATSRGSDSIFRDPNDLKPAGGEFIAALPNGLQVYFIADATGQRIDEAPTFIVTDRFAQDKTVRNGLACIRCHDRGMKSFVDSVRPAIENLPDATSIDRQRALRLYPPQEEMNALVERDAARFLAARSQLPEGATLEALSDVSRRYLERPISLAAAAGELGVGGGDVTVIRPVLRLPNFVRLGVSPLSAGQVIRRDLWEDCFPQMLIHTGLGQPVFALDGVIRTDLEGDIPPGTLFVRTNRRANVFSPGDEIEIVIENRGRETAFVEVLGVGTRGEVARVLPGAAVAEAVAIQAGDELRLGGSRVKPQLGREQLVLFAARQPFMSAQILRGGVHGDRFIHITAAGSVKTTAAMLRQTLLLETR
jgi:serine/threonine-protein kinase